MNTGKNKNKNKKFSLCINKNEESISSISRPTLNFTAKKIIYEGEKPTNNILVRQNELLQTNAIILTNIRVNCPLLLHAFLLEV